MADSFSTRFYNSAANSPKLGLPWFGNGSWSLSFSETIATTVLDADGDRHFCFPLPGVGTGSAGGIGLLHGFWLKAGDMDTGGPTLNADLVLVYTFNGVETTDATPIYDSSVAGLFSAALDMKWVDVWRTLPVADDGRCHVVFKTVTAATTPAAVNLTIIPVWS